MTSVTNNTQKHFITENTQSSVNATFPQASFDLLT